jgi:hypothetical protein
VLNDGRKEQEIIEVVQAGILGQDGIVPCREIMSSPGIIYEFTPFP